MPYLDGKQVDVEFTTHYSVTGAAPATIADPFDGLPGGGRMTTVHIDSVVIGERHRKDLGDIGTLAASIAEVGQLQPIVLDKDLRLIAGLRRLEAVRSLGRPLVDAVVIAGLDDALRALQAERDENTCRKDFTPVEAVALGRQIEEGLRELAERSQVRGLNRGDAPVLTIGENGERVPHASREKAAAAAVGMSSTGYWRAKKVIEAAEDDPETFGDLPEQMNATGNVYGALREVERRQANLDSSAPPKAGNGHRPPRHPIHGRSRYERPDEIAERLVTLLDGACLAVKDLDVAQLDPARRGDWATSLQNSIRCLRKLHKEIAQ